MSQYGANQSVPYTGQQDSNLVDNPRYQGQSAGTVPHGTTGPQQESRYGAAPLSNSAGNNDPMDSIRNPAAYGFQKHQPEGFRFPGLQHGQQQQGTGQGGYGAPPTTGGYGSDPNAQAGYGGGQSTGGYGGNPNPQSGYGSQTTSGYAANPNAQPGYGAQTGYGGQSTTAGAGLVDPNTRPNQAGYGSQPTGGYGAHQQQGQSEFAKDQPGYGQSGFGAPSQGQNTGSLWPQPATPPNAHKHDLTGQGQGGYDQQQQGYGQQQPGQGGYGQQQPGQGGASGQGNNSNVNHPSAGTGFGGGLGHQPHGGQDQPGGGYNTGMATGADAYSQSQPRNEGVVGKVKDAVGVGPNSGYDARTQTGNDAYVHGNHPVGMQDRVQGVNEPRFLGGENAAGGRDGVQSQGEHIPQSVLGEKRTEPGYDASKGHLPGHGGHHQKQGDTGLSGLPNTGTDSTGIDEGRGKGYEDTAGPYDSKLGTGTGTGTKTGDDTYDGTTTGTGTGTGTGIGTGSGYDDTTGTAPPKKGLMTKIKEKIHH